jgi:hypothetical protein
MNHAYRPDFKPRAEDGRVPFPAPPEAALSDAAAADAWFDQAVGAAGEILYRDRPGMPHRTPHDSQVFAMAHAAKAIAKGRILNILAAAGQLAHLADDAPLSDGAGRLLARLAALLDRTRCEQGWFHVTACNATLAQEMGKTRRTIARYLAELQGAGFLYRHFTTGSIGLDRPAIDLGPLVYRLPELEAAIADRALYRSEVRAERARCATLSEKTGGDDKNGTLNTDDLKSSNESVSALKRSVVDSACGQPQPSGGVKPNYGPIGRPKWIPKTHQVVDVCPTLAAYLSNPYPAWTDLIDAAYVLAAQYDLNDTTWKTLCGGLGREWAALTVAMVAELPASTFTRCSAPRIELRRASYIAGIARKMAKGEDVSITASWFRHVKRVKPPGFVARN